MKKVITLILITVICNFVIAQDERACCGCKSRHYAKLTRVRSGFRLSTPSDEVYLKLMREYRECVLKVIMVPNLFIGNGYDTYYYVYFKPSMKPIMQKFIISLHDHQQAIDIDTGDTDPVRPVRAPLQIDSTGTIVDSVVNFPPSPMVKQRRTLKYYWRKIKRPFINTKSYK